MQSRIKNIAIVFIFIFALNVSSMHHEEGKVAAQGMVYSEVFDLAGEMDMIVEKYECG